MDKLIHKSDGTLEVDTPYKKGRRVRHTIGALGIIEKDGTVSIGGAEHVVVAFYQYEDGRPYLRHGPEACLASNITLLDE